MYKTSGYFKGVPCPYFASGLCERPYCHFGHFKNDQQKDEEEATEQGHEKKVASSTFQKLDKVKWYKPTPIPKLINRSLKHKYSKPSNAPEYNPTPLHLLKKKGSNTQKDVLGDEYIPTSQTSSRKKTNVVAPQIKVSRKLTTSNCDNVLINKKQEDIKASESPLDNFVIVNIKTENLSDGADQTGDEGVYKEIVNIKEDKNENKILKITPIEVESDIPETDISDNVQIVSEVKESDQEVSGHKNVSKDTTLSETEETNSIKDADNLSIDKEKTSQDEPEIDVKTEEEETAATDVQTNAEICVSAIKVNEASNSGENEVNAKHETEVTSDIKCSCDHSDSKKEDKSQNRKKHKTSSSKHHKSSKSSHKKKKKKSSQKKKKKKKHKASDKKKYHSSSSSESESSSSDSDSEDGKDVSKNGHESNRSRKHSKHIERSKSSKRHHSSSSSSSRSRSRHSSSNKHKRSRSKSKKSSGKHSKSSKKRHHSSSSSSRSSSNDRKHAKRSKSSKTEKSASKRRKSSSVSSKEIDGKRRKSGSTSKHESIVVSEQIVVENCNKENGVKNNHKDSSATTIESDLKKEKTSTKSNLSLKVHSNIFDSLSKVVSSAMKDQSITLHDKQKQKSSSNKFSKNTETLSSSSTCSNNKKPVFQKNKSTLDLFGDDSSGNELESHQKSMLQTPTVTGSMKPFSSLAQDSDSDSIVLSSDSEPLPPPVSSSVPPCPTIDLDDVDLSDGDPFDECLQIFNETSSQTPTPKVKEPIDDLPEIDVGISSIGKKREAHQKTSTFKSSIQQRIESQRHAPRPSAAQVMHNRFLAMQNKQQDEVKEKTPVVKPRKPMIDPFAKKSRVAHASKSTAETKTSKNSKDNNRPPKKKAAKRPMIPEEFGSKVPTNVRQQYLNKMIDDCLKIYTEEQDAFDRGLSEEKAVYERSNNKAIYMRVAVNAIKKLRDELALRTPGGTNRASVSHSAVLGGLKATTTSFTLNRTGRSPLKFSVEIFVRHIQEKYLLTEEQLVANHFPRSDPDKPGNAIILVEDKYKSLSSDKYERHCVRCGKSFHVNYKGEYVKSEQCIHHWGKAWKTRIARGVWENKWTCCGGDLGAKGCQICKAHVHEYNKFHNTEGFVKTLESSSDVGWDCKAYALDCEMVYTIAGSELARVTVVDFNCETVLEKLVKPGSPVLDYNTRFSGITESTMKGVKTTLRDIQAIMLSLFTEKTILIGHSLESDLMALRMIHSNVVDTSVVFPHKMGPPYKRALKTLVGEILQKIIQEDVDGHDSLEDAASALQLMIWKAKDDLKHNRINI